ncbi:unnamed protein product [Prorocentrum cordatum]|nr:unnamed protein product [Polarella glacialis]
MSKGLEASRIEDALAAAEEMMRCGEMPANELLYRMLCIACELPGVERFARVVNCCTSGGLCMQALEWAGVVGRLMERDAPHAQVRVCLNFGVPRGGEVLGLVPVDADRESDVMKVFAGAEHLDLGELSDENDVAEAARRAGRTVDEWARVPKKLVFTIGGVASALAGEYKRCSFVSGDGLRSKRPVFKNKRKESTILAYFFEPSEQDAAPGEETWEAGWYLGDEVGGGGITFAYCPARGNQAMAALVPPEEDTWLVLDGKGGKLEEPGTFTKAPEKAKASDAQVVEWSEAQQLLEQIDLAAVPGRVGMDKDPDAIRYFCHFFILLHLEQLAEVSTFRGRFGFRTGEELARFGIAVVGTKVTSVSMFRQESRRAALPGWPEVGHTHVTFKLNPRSVDRSRFSLKTGESVLVSRGHPLQSRVGEGSVKFADFATQELVVMVHGKWADFEPNAMFRLDSYANRTTFERQLTSLLQFITMQRTKMQEMLIAAGVGKVDLAVLGGDGLVDPGKGTKLGEESGGKEAAGEAPKPRNSSVLTASEVRAMLTSRTPRARAIESLYADKLIPFGRILLKRVGEHAADIAAKGVLSGKTTCSYVSTDEGHIPFVDPMHLMRVCRQCPRLRVECVDSGEYVAMTPTPAELWADLVTYFHGPADSQPPLPAGRYNCARALKARGLPFLGGRSLGEVCHTLALAMSQKKILGHFKGHTVPYARSESGHKPSPLRAHPWPGLGAPQPAYITPTLLESIKPLSAKWASGPGGVVDDRPRGGRSGPFGLDPAWASGPSGLGVDLAAWDRDRDLQCAGWPPGLQGNSLGLACAAYALETGSPCSPPAPASSGPRLCVTGAGLRRRRSCGAGAMNQMQQFSTAPQAVGTRKKFREPDDRTMSTKGNMMQDRRVVRGNTYAALVAPQPDAAEVQKQREAQRRRLMRASQKEKRPGTPEPVMGRKHMDIQTDSYLEELTERTVEFEAETQTDFLLDRPPSPLFLPAKIGVDIATQIEEGELFDFDVEVEPILEVLVGKTLEQSVMEVLEEEELESLRRHQEDFEKRRNAELQEVQRMEAAESRRNDEMLRRKEQQAAQREQDLSKMRKVVSRSVAAAHLSSLKDRALQHLLDAGVFADPMEMAVETAFMPQLFKMAAKQMASIVQTRNLLDSVASEAVGGRLDAHGRVLAVERRRLAQIDQAEREARLEKAEEAAARQRDAERVEREQSLLAAWQARVPTPPPPAEEFQVSDLDAENKLLILDRAPGKAKVPEEMMEELQAKLAGLTEGQKLVATLVGPDGRLILQAAEGGAAAASEAAAEEPAGGGAPAPEAAEAEEELPTLAEVRVAEPTAPTPEAEAAEDPEAE